MSLALWLALARDVAAVLALVFMGLMAALFWSGQDGVSGGVAASVAVAAAAGLLALGLYGLLSAATGLSMAAIGLLFTALILAGAFYGAHAYGARGLWLAGLAMAGVALAWALLWVFSLRLGAGLGPAAPMVAYAALALFAAGALSAASRAAQPETRAERTSGLMVSAQRMLGAPPPWFDCAYAALGGSAANPAHCPFTPPEIAAAPPWAEEAEIPRLPAPESAGLSALERSSGADEETARAPRLGRTPDLPALPAPPRSGNPAFDLAETPPQAAPDAPDGLSPPANRDLVAAPAEAEDAAAEVEQVAAAARRAVSGLAASPGRREPPRQPAAPGLESPVPEGRPGPEIAAFHPAEAAAVAPPDAEAAPRRPSADSDRPMTAFVCFPMTSLAADRLCPDQRFGVDDLEIAWRMPGGAARQSPAGVECYADPSAPLHATVMAHLSGDLAGLLPRGPEGQAGPGEDRLRKAEALYEALTRLLSAARAARGDERARIMLSLYVAGGSSLRSPWAQQSFGPERADRLFDLGSISQSLAMLRRLREETQAVRKSRVGADFAESVRTMIRERPAAPTSAGAPARNVVLLIVDSLAIETFDEAEASRLGAELAAAGLTAMTVEIGPGGATPALTRLAERSGGVAVAAADAESLFEALSRALDKARRFCAVRVVGPERFFAEGAIEISLRRRMKDGCALEQIAAISCDGLSLKERVDPNGQE